MAVWNNYNSDDYNKHKFGIIPVGKYRVRIEQAEEQTSSKGKNMIKLTLAVSGYNTTLWYYLVLDNSTPETIQQTNRRLGSVWDSFGIQEGNMNEHSWVGHVGGAQVKHSKDQNDNDRADVHYFLTRENVDKLPAWQDGSHQTTNQTPDTQAPIPEPDVNIPQGFDDFGLPFTSQAPNTNIEPY